ncbi:uncharacterized protein EDB91DRAFT_1113808, partial [Suillus paluster]|uniref:uncharacterized protein n=1 Tax=Suillus paluster TaxID=48578 RepID=UPI001B85C11C
ERGRSTLKKIRSLNRKEEQDLMQEIAVHPPRTYIDETQDDTSMHATSDSSDCSFNDTASDSKSLSRHSFTSYTLIKRKPEALPRNMERLQSRKMQHHFTQAYIPTKTSKLLSAASMTPNDSTGLIKTQLNITNDDLPTALSPPSGHPTKHKVHVPNEAHDDLHSLTYSTSASSSSVKTPSPSNGEPKRTESTVDVEEGTDIHMASCLSQTPVRATATDANVSPNSTPFPLLPVVDSTGLPALPIEHVEPSTECIALDSPFTACEIDGRHVSLSSSLVPSLPFLHSKLLYDCHSATDGTNLPANNSISSLTSIFPTPFLISNTPSMTPPSYGVALNAHPLAFPSLPEQVPCAEQPVSTFSGPSLSTTTYCGFAAEPLWSGPFNWEPLSIPSDYASFVTNDAIRDGEGHLPQPQWISHSDRIDVEMADVEAVVEFTMIPDQCFGNPSASGPFPGFPTQVPATTAAQYACTYEPPAAISAFSGVSTALPAVGPSSDGFSTIAIESIDSQSAFDSTACHFPGDAGSAIQSVFDPSSRWSSSIFEPHSATFSTSIPEQFTSGSGSTYSYSNRCEIPSAEQHVYENDTRERDIQRTSWKANNLHTIFENEEYAQNATAQPKVDVHEPAASLSVSVSKEVIHQETVVQSVGHDNGATAPVHRQPQYIAPSARDSKETQPDDDAKTEPDDDTKTEPDDDAKTEPDDGIDEKDVNAEILAHAILDIPLPPAVVASVQLLGQRKRRNSCCSAGITRMRAKRRQMNTDENEEDGNGGIRAQRTRFNHLSRPSPYGSMGRRRKGHVKTFEKWGDNPLGGPHSEASVPSGAIVQTSGVEPADNSQSRSPFDPSIRNSSNLHGLDRTTPARGIQRHTSIPTSPTPSRRQLRDNDSHSKTSKELPDRERIVKQTRFKSCVEQIRESAQPSPPPANPTSDRRRPATLRRITGYGSAGRQHWVHHPTNGGVQVRTGKEDVTRPARRPRVVSDTHNTGPLRSFTLAVAS